MNGGLSLDVIGCSKGELTHFQVKLTYKTNKMFTTCVKKMFLSQMPGICNDFLGQESGNQQVPREVLFIVRSLDHKPGSRVFGLEDESGSYNLIPLCYLISQPSHCKIGQNKSTLVLNSNSTLNETIYTTCLDCYIQFYKFIYMYIYIIYCNLRCS